MDQRALKGCEVLLFKCAGAKKGEKILVITDDSSKEIGELMYGYASTFTDTTLVRMSDRKTHGSSPTESVGAAMAASDIILSATKFSLYNTPARINACKAGARFVNMSDYSMSMLEEGCLFVDFAKTRALVDSTAARIVGKQCTITTPAGTKFTTSIAGRTAVNGYGIADQPGMAASPPNIETAVGPADNSAEGILVVDGSILLPGLGVIKEPITVHVSKGYITSIQGGEEAKLFEKSLKDLNDDRVYLIGEVGFGMNPGGSLCGRMLVDEGVFGTMHIGIGNNLSYGGTNATPIHIDLVMRKPTCTIDDKIVYKDGVIV